MVVRRGKKNELMLGIWPVGSYEEQGMIQKNGKGVKNERRMEKERWRRRLVSTAHGPDGISCHIMPQQLLPVHH